MKKIILKSIIKHESETPYRAVIIERDGQKILQIEQYFKRTDEWIGTPGQWLIDTLKGKHGTPYHSQDLIYIDYGQQWYIEGMTAVMQEVEELTTAPSKCKYQKETIRTGDYICEENKRYCILCYSSPEICPKAEKEESK